MNAKVLEKHRRHAFERGQTARFVAISTTGLPVDIYGSNITLSA